MADNGATSILGSIGAVLGVAAATAVVVGGASYAMREVAAGRNPARGKGRRQQHSVGAEIVDNMARVVWAERWASRREEKGESFSGVDVFDAAPPTPSHAKKWALKAARETAKLNGLGHLDPYEAMERLYDRAVAANQAAGRRSEPPHRFGSDLGLMITGVGVSWFDDNAKFDLEVPTVWYEL